MSKVYIPLALYEQLRRAAKRPPRYVEDLHPLQRAFVEDQKRRKAALCGRRAGKSWGIAVWLLEGMAGHPGRRSVYIALTSSTAKQIIWDGCLEKISRQYGLRLRLVTDRGNLFVHHPNGSSLWLAGCATKKELDKFRGQKYHRACIDEAQAFPDWIKTLVEEVLEPALGDYKGQLALTGTPSAVSAGYFWEATTDLVGGFSSSHHWTARENPFIDGEDLFQTTLANNGWKEDYPTFVREYLGEWCDDQSSLVYPFTTDNRWTPTGEGPYGLPEGGEYRFGLGVDIGFGEHTTAFVLAALHVGQNRVYVLRSETKTRMLPEEMRVYCARLRAEVERNTGGGALRIIVDEGALGKAFAEHMRRMGTPCVPAKKTEKRTYQDYVGGLIASGVVQVNPAECSELLSQAAKLQWDPETGAEDERYKARHCLDAFLYVTRDLWPTWDVKGQLPEPGTPAYAQWEVEQHRKALIEKTKKEQRSKGFVS